MVTPLNGTPQSSQAFEITSSECSSKTNFWTKNIIRSGRHAMTQSEIFCVIIYVAV